MKKISQNPIDSKSPKTKSVTPTPMPSSYSDINDEEYGSMNKEYKPSQNTLDQINQFLNELYNENNLQDNS